MMSWIKSIFDSIFKTNIRADKHRSPNLRNSRNQPHGHMIVGDHNTIVECEKLKEANPFGEELNSRYKKCRTNYGSYVFALKKSEANGDEPEWICVNCAEAAPQVKSTLHPLQKPHAINGVYISVAECTKCNTDFFAGEYICYAEDMGKRPFPIPEGFYKD